MSRHRLLAAPGLGYQKTMRAIAAVGFMMLFGCEPSIGPPDNPTPSGAVAPRPSSAADSHSPSPSSQSTPSAPRAPAGSWGLGAPPPVPLPGLLGRPREEIDERLQPLTVADSEGWVAYHRQFGIRFRQDCAVALRVHLPEAGDCAEAARLTGLDGCPSESRVGQRCVWASRHTIAEFDLETRLFRLRLRSPEQGCDRVPDASTAR